MDLEKNNKKTIVFIHIPKTGGTTIHKLLSLHFKEDEICPIRNKFLYKPEIDMTKYKLISGHFSYRDIMSYNLNNPIIFTILREPKSRIISKYYFMKSHNKEFIEKYHPMYREAKDFSLLKYLNYLNEYNKKNDMVEMLTSEEIIENKLESAKNNLTKMPVFGIMERMEESIACIFKFLDLPIPEVIPHELKFENLERDYSYCESITKEPITGEIKEVLRDLVMDDNELYNLSLNLFPPNLTYL